MIDLMHTLRACLPCTIAATALLLSPHTHAGEHIVDGATITTVSVNGGADTRNAGTTCIRISSAVSPACPAGFVAIPNNNKQLIAAALLNKAAGSQVWLYYYEDAADRHHCPGHVVTPCSVISLESK
jgi:hypothetical protein